MRIYADSLRQAYESNMDFMYNQNAKFAQPFLRRLLNAAVDTDAVLQYIVTDYETRKYTG